MSGVGQLIDEADREASTRTITYVKIEPRRSGVKRSVGLKMDVAIAKANIEHFKSLLETETDESKLAVLRRLLAEEEVKLASALKSRGERKTR